VSSDDGALPIKLDATSNGEFAPVPLPAWCVEANRAARDAVGANARRVGLPRRRFLASACGAATTLLALNAACGRAGRSGGAFVLPPESAFEPAAAEAAIGGREFIFDVQNHHVTPERPWRERSAFWDRTVRAFPFADCGLPDPIGCFSARQYVKEVFGESDTALAVLSFVPEPDRDAAPLLAEEAAATREIVDALQGTQRLLIHGAVHPGFPGELERMDELASRYSVSAWKTYTQYGPNGRGYRLDDPKLGIPFLEKARALGVRVVCVHKGFPLPGMAYEFSLCDDVGRAAKLFPDLHFLVYHSGFETGTIEGPYDPARAQSGTDSLVRALAEHGVAPGSNVYAELGSTWRYLMRDPTQAAHALGKLLRAVGADNLLWGTDSIWYGSPQDQIQAFRSFQIAPELRERHGYPELTPALRAKVFGLNALRPYGIAQEDALGRSARATRLPLEERAGFDTHGPRTRREFLRFIRPSRG
jgi:predicted TIM-barrel fold metal-dependent hydrolase